MKIHSLVLLSWLIALSGCKKEPPAPQRTEEARRDLEALRPRFASLHEKFSALHREFDPLPPGLPNFGETRGKFYASDIGLGTLSAKLPWLEGRLAAAADARELSEISRDIAYTADELRQVDRVALELAKEVQPFKHATEEKLELQAQGKSTCE
jgi:hypothetical protein